MSILNYQKNYLVAIKYPGDPNPMLNKKFKEFI